MNISKDGFLSDITVADNDIAIVGMSCRFPGNVNSPEEFWEFLLAGGDGIVDVPSDRWENKSYYDVDRNKKNKMYINAGGFIENIDKFDPLFFGISPKEAPQIDPQHRWLLELTYEAFENAGLKISEYKGSNTAVYMGQFMHDYEQLILDSTAHDNMTSHSATGPSMTLTSNRISYLFDFTGPSVTLDTACSSSLVALDMACKAVLSGDSEMAIAGGVNILLRPELTMSICRASMLSPDCRCKSFDASANGYVRSEGAGIVVIRKLADALRDGNNVLAVIKATGVNQDGQTVGITVPSGAAQQKLLISSLGRANVAAEDIQYAEAHGTGTAVGDPIEVNALGAILGKRGKDIAPCVIGSVKSNIGHTEAAAGMAGLIKTVMAMNYGVIPKNIHYHVPNPSINLQQLNIQIASEALNWPETQGKLRHAVVNSFGFGGTNANVILQQSPRILSERALPVSENQQTGLLFISSKTEKGLRAQATKYQEYFKNKNDSAVTYGLSDFQRACYVSAVKREHHKYRLAVSAENVDGALLALQDFISGNPSQTYAKGAEKNNLNQKLAFVFSGMGTQSANMGRSLYQCSPIFKAEIDRCDSALSAYTNWSLVDVLFNETDLEKIHKTCFAQPGIFAIQVALAAHLKSLGVVPEVIVGHSAGEVGAAYVAGALSFDDAIKVVYFRSQLQHTTEGMGKMLAVGLSEAELMPYLSGFEDKVSIGAINSDDAITLAGDGDALQNIAERLEKKDVFSRFLKVGVPYHSPVMDQLKAPLIAALKSINVQRPHTQLFSTVSGMLTQFGDWGAEYWADNVREPVRFKHAIDNILELGINCFVEIAPHSALASSVQKNMQGKGVDGACISTLKRDQDSRLMLSQTLANLHVLGVRLDWDKLYPEGGGFVALPNYAWQHSSYWAESEEVRSVRLRNISRRNGFTEPVHPLLGSQFNSASNLWQRNLDLNDLGYIAGHKVEQEIVYPGAAYIEMALALSRQQKEANTYEIKNVEFKKALFVDGSKASIIETVLDKETWKYEINAVDPQTGSWSQYSTGILSQVDDHDSSSATKKLMLNDIRLNLSKYKNKVEFYAHCHNLGLNYTDKFQIVDQAWFNDQECLVEISIPADVVENNYLLHPVILDGAFQSIFPTLESGFLPTKIETLKLYKKPEGNIYAYLQTRYKDEDDFLGDLLIISGTGDLLVEVIGVELKATKTKIDRQDYNSKLYNFVWSERSLEEISVEKLKKHWIIFTDSSGVGSRLAAELVYREHSICIVEKGYQFEKISKSHFRLAGESADDFYEFFNDFRKINSGIIYLWGADTTINEDQSSDVVFDKCFDQATQLMNLAQGIDRTDWASQQKLFLLTCGAQFTLPTHHQFPEPLQAALWGFGRVFASEHPEHDISMIDVIGDVDDDTLAKLAHQITAGEYEQESAFFNGKRYVNRLQHLSGDALKAYPERQAILSLDGVVKVEKTFSDNLALIGGKRVNVKENEISISVITSTMSQLHANALISQKKDREGDVASYFCVGIIAEIGGDGSGFEVGDKVVALVSKPYTSQVTVPAAHVLLCDKDIKNNDILIAATHFLTARYLLDSFPQINENAKVLVLGELCGLSLVLQQLLEQKSITAVTSSGNIEEGDLQNDVDIIINTGVMSDCKKALPFLKPFGHWIDVGVIGGAEERKIAPDFARNNLSYHALNYAQLITHKPHQCLAIMRDLLDSLVDNPISDNNLPLMMPPAFSIQDIDAINSFFESQEVESNIALNFDIVRPIVSSGFLYSPVNDYSTYLVTGGLGGLGLEIMDWLINQGAKSIVLMGRSFPSPEAIARIAKANGQKVNVEVMHGDVTLSNDVSHILSHINKTMPPLAGIIHSAGVLEDGVISQQNSEKFSRVLLPKVKGAWNLHQLSLDLNLDFFVCFSSIASIIGWSGQSNYAAANAFMDCLAHRRHAQGKPALTINWGPWSGSGMAANLDDRDIQRMNDAGMSALSATQGLAAMETLLINRVPQAGVFEVDWQRIAKQYPSSKKKTLLVDLVGEQYEDAIENFSDQFLRASEDKRQTLLVEKISCMLADVLGMESGALIDSEKNVFEYGMNSLMSMDFKNKLQATMGIKLPTTLVLKYPTVTTMTKFIGEALINSEPQEKVSADVLLWSQSRPHAYREYQVNGQLAVYGPTLHVWFEQEKSAHFNVGFMIALDDNYFDKNVLQAALNILFSYHDGCRLQISKAAGAYANKIVGLDSDVAIEQHDLRGMEYTSAVKFIEDNNNKLQASFSFDEFNCLYRVANYQLNDEKTNRIFLTFHHYLADGLSLKIFAADFERVYMQVYRKENVYFPAKQHSLISWSEKLRDFSQNQALSQVAYWESSMSNAGLCAFGQDYPITLPRQSDSWQISSNHIVETRAVSAMESLCKAYGLDMADLITYTLIKALTNHTGTHVHWIDFVSHMRSGVFDDIDLTNVFGQLSDSCPTLFKLDEKLGLAAAVKSLREQRESVPNSGLGMRTLVFNAPQKSIADKYYDNAKPKIVFNIDLSDYSRINNNTWFEMAKESFGQVEIMHKEVDVLPDLYIQVNFKDYVKSKGISITAWCATDAYDEKRIDMLMLDMCGETETLLKAFDLTNKVFTSEKV